MSSGGQQLLEIDDIQPYLNSCWIDFWQPEDRPKITAAIAAAKAGGIGKFQAFCPSAKGAPRWWEVITTPICNADGQPEQLLSVSRDITEHKQAEAEARESEQRYRQVQSDLTHVNRVATMGQLTASIAHEVGQPIAGVVSSGFAARRWLAGETPNQDAALRAIERVISDGARAMDIIGRIRDMIKKGPPKRDNFDINKAIQDLIALAYAQAHQNGVSIKTEFADSLPLVHGDRVQLQQVILNLIINAIEAMSGLAEGAREVLVSTRQSDQNAILVAVQDSGPGLDLANADRVFEAFYTTKSSGMGMGLSISRSIIDDHGGRLWASANEPRGVIFQFTLPAHSDSAS